jgi:hypothetical protein
MKTLKIHVSRSSDPELATASLIADTSEKALVLDSIRSTIQSFKDHMQSFSDSESSICLAKEFHWGDERVVVRCGNSRPSLFSKLIALFQR